MRICNLQCLKCRHDDCINDEPASLREISIIEADNRLVKWMRLTNAEREKRNSKKISSRKWYEEHAEEEKAKREATIEQRYATMKAWRERMRKCE